MKKIYLIVMFILISGISCDNYIQDLANDFTKDTVICVNQSASEETTGIGWSAAYKSLYEAVNAAKDGDEIWICGDLTTENNQIVIQKDITIIGGFSESDQSKDDRNNSRLSVISSDLNVSMILINGSANIYLENVDMINIDTSANSISVESNSKLMLYNCVFDNNVDTGQQGGAIRVENSELIVNNCSFTNNESYGGGAIEVLSSSLEIINSNFYNNYAEHDGGAIFTNSSGYELNIKNTTFSANLADDYGDSIYTNANLITANCTFENDPVTY